MKVIAYMVYNGPQSKDEVWGVQMGGESRAAVHLKNGAVKTRTISQTQLPGFLADLARRGFKLQDGGKYFDEARLEFVAKHPDFAPGIATSNYVLFAEPDDMVDAVSQLDQLALDRNVTNQLGVGRSWFSKQLQNDNFLVALDTSPLWALLVAEVAIRNKWPITPSRGGCPTSKPSEQPTDWALWLHKFFAVETVSKAQMSLGWTAMKIIQKSTTVFNSAVAELPVDLL